MEKKYVPYIGRNHCKKIWLEEILYIEHIGRINMIVTEKESYRMYGKLSELEVYLDHRFYHCLQYTIVNFDQVSEMRDQTIWFQNQKRLMIGRNNYITIKQKFANYIKNKKMGK